MDLTKHFKRAEKLAIDNSPVLLTGLGIAGLISTAILSGRAGYRTAQILSTRDPHESATEKAQATWPEYIPAVGVGVFSVVCIIASNRVSNRRAAALAAAYSLSERTMLEYKDKVVEKLGQGKEQKIRDEIAQERVTSNPPSRNTVVVTGDGDVLCYDSYSGRYFLSSAEKIHRAVNKLNHALISDMYASLNDFYVLLGLEHVEVGEEVGWTSSKLLEIQISATITEEEKPCLVITFDSSPIRNYHKFG